MALDLKTLLRFDLLLLCFKVIPIYSGWVDCSYYFPPYIRSMSAR